ncbi:MAG: AMP-binding protein [Actinomycetota bacterium]
MSTLAGDGAVIRAETVVELLERSTSTIIEADGGARQCADVLEAGRSLAADLAAAGVEPGDRIAIQMANEPTYLELLVAAAVGGFVVMSVNLRFADALADSLIERSGARMVIRSASDLPARARDPKGVPGPDSADDHYVIFTTSGTTSAPKLVVHGQRSIAAHAGDVAAAFGYGPDSVVLVPLPLCGVFGFTVVFGALAGNATLILPSAFEADATAAIIEEHAVTSLHGSDDMFHRLLETDRDLSSIESSGYARFNSALDGIVERCDARGIPLSGLYGMSEVQALFAWRGGVGRSIGERWRPAGPLVSPQAQCRVVDDELQLQGPSLFAGYLADGGSEIDRELTDRHFDGPWFRTGDLAVEDGPRSFEYITRMGDAMRLGGFLVAPTEIEGVLLGVDGIEQAQVVAAGTDRGTRPVAFVITDGTALDESAAIAHCGETLARFKCPVRVVPVDAFPVTDGPNGVKIQRTELRRRAEALLAISD